MKRFILTTHENCEEFISSTQRTKNSRKPLRMLVRNWKHQLLPQCLATLWRAIRIVGVVHPTKSKQNLRVFWKLVNPQDCVWENHCRHIMKTILQEEETIHYSIKIWFTNLYPMPQAMKIPRSKGSSGQGMGKIGENFRRGTWRKSEARKRWSMKQGRRAQGLISPHWWTSVIWKNAELEAKHPKYKGRVVLRGDIV